VSLVTRLIRSGWPAVTIAIIALVMACTAWPGTVGLLLRVAWSYVLTGSRG
jgi:hypothetical protein